MSFYFLSSFWTITTHSGVYRRAGQTINKHNRPISDWARRHINDKYVRQSLKDGYRCRSVYKLLQIQEKYNLLEPGLTVMECGCAPGSWSQVAAKLTNSGGLYDQEKLDGLLVGKVIT
jgi:hypothetical protein